MAEISSEEAISRRACVDGKIEALISQRES
jgi:hypothetical protein